jgi:hypothetical protein
MTKHRPTIARAVNNTVCIISCEWAIMHFYYRGRFVVVYYELQGVVSVFNEGLNLQISSVLKLISYYDNVKNRNDCVV